MDFTTKELANQITLNVTIKGYRGWLIRLWLAKQLIKLACWIAWVNVEWTENG